jgi:hypothetical protein
MFKSREINISIVQEQRTMGVGNMDVLVKVAVSTTFPFSLLFSVWNTEFEI